MTSDLRPSTNLVPDTAVSCDHARATFDINAAEYVEPIRFDGKDHLVMSHAGDKKLLER